MSKKWLEPPLTGAPIDWRYLPTIIHLGRRSGLGHLALLLLLLQLLLLLLQLLLLQ